MTLQARVDATADMLAASWWGRILAQHDTEPAELGSGLLKVLMGAWLLLPFDSLGSSPKFAILTLLPEWLWAALLLALGGSHLTALRAGRRDIRRRTATAGYILWFTFAAVFVGANPPAFGWLAFGVLGLSQLWCSLRLRRPL